MAVLIGNESNRTESNGFCFCFCDCTYSVEFRQNGILNFINDVIHWEFTSAGLAIPIEINWKVLIKIRTRHREQKTNQSSRLLYKIILAVFKNRYHYQRPMPTNLLMGKRLFFSASSDILQNDSIFEIDLFSKFDKTKSSTSRSNDWIQRWTLRNTQSGK